MKNDIRQKASELGFDLCRVTSADPPQSSPEFHNWIAQGEHGEMQYLERGERKRADLQEILPGAKSVVCVAISYPEVPDASDARPNYAGVIARYARFEDYHDVLKPKLKELAECITALGGAGHRSLWYVDTGPILERDLAQRAGIGFVGKHTNLIGRTLGNWIFLAEILTTVELESDASERNRCGTCQRCITACPTQAIRAPFDLDARRCISYLTIELKTSIPIEFRRLIGNRIYGCDDCLEVCPWNRFAKEGRLLKEHARRDLAVPDLIELLALDNAGFKKKFAGTPMLRTKRRGVLRNVCVALGNVGDTSALPALERVRADHEPLIAEHAKWAIDEIESRV